MLILASASRDPSPVPASQTSLAAENTSRWASNRKTTCNREAVGQGKTPCAAPPATVHENQRRRPALPEGRSRPSPSGHHGIAAPRHGQKGSQNLKTQHGSSLLSAALRIASAPRRRRDGSWRDQRGARGGNMQPVQACTTPSILYRPVTLRRISSKLPRAKRSMRHAMHA